jgi:7-cyano-7-deazaguanine synthase
VPETAVPETARLPDRLIASPKAVVLLSGGMDSTTTLAIAKDAGFELYALTFRYGQRHEVEIEAARNIAQRAGVADHVVAEIDLRAFGGSALTDDIPVPKARSSDAMGDSVPITYVPARNTIFLSFALAWAEVIGANDIFIGVNALDYSGYPDCRPEYIEAFQRMADFATKAGVEEGRRLTIHTPLIMLSKAQIVQRGLQLGVDFGATVSCYDPSPSSEACGECDACRLRIKGFEEAGTSDPTRYERHRG